MYKRFSRHTLEKERSLEKEVETWPDNSQHGSPVPRPVGRSKRVSDGGNTPTSTSSSTPTPTPTSHPPWQIEGPGTHFKGHASTPSQERLLPIGNTRPGNNTFSLHYKMCPMRACAEMLVAELCSRFNLFILVTSQKVPQTFPLILLYQTSTVGISNDILQITFNQILDLTLYEKLEKLWAHHLVLPSLMVA